MENSIEETIKQLKLMLKVRKEQKEIIECAGGSCMNCNPDIKALSESIEILSDYKRVLKENEELKSDNLEYQRIQDIFDKRTYRKKYLEERRKEEPNLLYPDADEIYRRYYELKKENQQLRNEYINIQQNSYIQGRAEEQKKYFDLINKIEDKIDKFDYEFEKAKRKNDEDRANYYWDLIRNFKKILESEE